jgi:hypothetical protein
VGCFFAGAGSSSTPPSRLPVALGPSLAETDPEAGQVPTPDTPYPTALLIPQWRVEQILRARRYDLDVAHSGSGALDTVANRHPDLVVLDLRHLITEPGIGYRLVP